MGHLNEIADMFEGLDLESVELTERESHNAAEEYGIGEDS